MLKQIVIAGSAAAVVLGAGTAALAASGSSSPSSPAPAASASTSTTPAQHKAKNQLRRSLHATWVTRGKGGFVTHDAIRGSVTAVSATSITVQAADKVSQTYAIGSATKVHSRAAGKGRTAPITDVHTGDKVLVVGTGTTGKTATWIADVTK